MNINEIIKKLPNLSKEEFLSQALVLKEMCTKEHLHSLKQVKLLLKVDDDRLFYLKKLIDFIEKTKDFSSDDLKKCSNEEKIALLKNIISKKNIEKIDDVIELLKSETDEKVIATSISVIKELGNNSHQSLIIPFLRHVDLRVKANAVEAIEKIGSEDCIKYIIPLTDSKNNRLKNSCMKALWKFGEEKLIAEISKIIDSQNNNLLLSTIFILGEMKSKKAKEILDSLLDKPLDEKIHNKIKEKLIIKDPDTTEKFLNNVKVIYVRTKEDKFFFGLTITLIIITLFLYVLINHMLPSPKDKTFEYSVEYKIAKAKNMIENGEINKGLLYIEKQNEKLKNNKINEFIAETMYKFGRFDKSLNYYLKLNSKNSSKFCFNIGNIYRKKFNYDKAIKYYNKSIEANKEFYQAYSNLGIVYFKKGNVNKSIEYFKKANFLSNGKDLSVMNNLGYSYFKAGNLNKALMYYKKVLNIDNNYVETLNNIAVLLLKQKKFKMVSSYLKKIIKIAPDSNFAQQAAKGLKLLKNVKKGVKKN